MIKIGITGSLSSGKSAVAKLMSRNKYPLFDADKAVVSLYKKKDFIKPKSIFENYSRYFSVNTNYISFF